MPFFMFHFILKTGKQFNPSNDILTKYKGDSNGMHFLYIVRIQINMWRISEVLKIVIWTKWIPLNDDALTFTILISTRKKFNENTTSSYLCLYLTNSSTRDIFLYEKNGGRKVLLNVLFFRVNFLRVVNRTQHSDIQIIKLNLAQIIQENLLFHYE